MTYFKKPNIFTVLIIVASMVFAFRLANIMTFKNIPADQIGITTPAAAVEETKESPPPMPAHDTKAADGEHKEAAPAGDHAATDEHAPAKKDAPKEAAKSDLPEQIPSDDRAFSSAEIEVLQSLAQRRDALEKREKALSDREALLKAAEQEVDRKVTELNKLKTEMQDLLGQQEKAEQDRTQSLVKIYENMKPKEAARIFDSLEMPILLDVISKMSERKSSPILASMNPDKARAVTIELAEQRKMPANKEKPPSTTPPNLPGLDAPAQ